MSKVNQRQNFSTNLVKASKADYKALFDFAPVPLIEGIWGAQFQVLKANAEAIQLFGCVSFEEFAQCFGKILLGVPNKVLLEMLSSRLKSDMHETEFKLYSVKGVPINVFMRMVYIPSSDKGHQHVVLAFHDITQTKRNENLLKKLSQIDGLTQLLNQRTILSRAEEEFQRAQRYKLDLTFVILDLDNFKKVNDTLGHLTGDKCIKQVARVLQSTLRKTDIIGRYGGDEFLVLLPETKADQAIVPVKRFMEEYERHSTVKNKGDSIHTTFSIGISGFLDKGITSSKDLISCADKALYMSKTSGGNQFNIYKKN